MTEQGKPQDLVELIEALAIGLADEFADRLSEHPRLRPDELHLLTVVPSEGVKSAVIVERSGLGEKTAQGILKTLQGKGLIRRIPDPKDKRLKLVQITEAGEAMVGDIDSARAATATSWRLALGDRAADRLESLLTTLLMRSNGVEETGFRNRWERRRADNGVATE